MKLTKRELEVLKLLALDSSNSYIADYLKISIHTVKSHITSILQKLCLENRQEAKVAAINILPLQEQS